MSPERAISIANGVALEAKWPWIPPVRASVHRRWFVGRRYWVVWTNDGMRGRNVRVEIDDDTGRVLLKGYLPR